MTTTSLTPYCDDRGNKVIYSGSHCKDVIVDFRGSNNVLTVAEGANLRGGRFSFDCDNGAAFVGRHTFGGLSAYVRIGQDATVTIGENVTTTKSVTITCVEGQQLTIGDDCMIATGCHIRTDDAHPIFDVRTGRRVNPSKSVVVGNHVWLANGVVVLGGSSIGDGTVLGVGSIAKGEIPNNCVAVGSPAKVVRRDTAWERPHLSLATPFYKPDATTVARSPYWNMTEDNDESATPDVDGILPAVR